MGGTSRSSSQWLWWLRGGLGDARREVGVWRWGTAVVEVERGGGPALPAVTALFSNTSQSSCFQHPNNWTAPSLSAPPIRAQQRPAWEGDRAVVLNSAGPRSIPMLPGELPSSGSVCFRTWIALLLS